MPDGSWSEQRPDGDNYSVGRTALVTLALLSAGESHQSDPLRRAIKYLTSARPRTTYSVALRAAAFAQLPEVVRPKILRTDLAWLENAVISTGDCAGMYTYVSDRRATAGDFSNSQYGALGVWYAADTGIEVPLSYWKKVESAWLKGQCPDGGWPYTMGDDRSYASMTAAGIATLYITHDYLHVRDSDSPKTKSDPPLDRGIAWLADHFAVDHNTGLDAVPLEGGSGGPDGAFHPMPQRNNPPNGGTWINYMLFGYERVGEATGLTRFGAHRWFDEGADYLCQTQHPDGSWVNTCLPESDTAYSLLFLARGLSPVVIQKLQFGDRWNNHPRDLSALIHFLRQVTERHVNWQIVNIDSPSADWRQSPIVYLAGDHTVTFTDDQCNTLRTYVNQGGMLLCAEEGDTTLFAKSIETLARQLFPNYSMRDLPRSHPTYHLNFATDDTTPAMRAVSNGIRELLVLIPHGDIPMRMQVDGGAARIKHSPYTMAANLLLYATDSANPERQEPDHWIDRNPTTPSTRTETIDLLRYNDNWNPEPAAWQRLANELHNDGAIELTAHPSDLDAPPAATSSVQSINIAHLTAAAALNLNDAERQGLAGRLDGRALLIFDAAGGSAEAAASFERLTAELLPTSRIEPLPLDHPIYVGNFSGGLPISTVTYRRSAADRVGRTTEPRLRGLFVDDHLRAIISEEDLTAALAGVTTAGIVGYTPQSAECLMRNILLWCAAGQLPAAKPPTSHALAPSTTTAPR
jgi:hypothetical protein